MPGCLDRRCVRPLPCCSSSKQHTTHTHPASQALKQAGVSEVVLAINYQPEVRARVRACKRGRCLPA